MHYRNGREAKNGDIVLSLDGYGNNPITGLGVLHSAVPGNDFCNGSIAALPSKGACIVDCLHIDDVMEMLKEKVLDKRPAGK